MKSADNGWNGVVGGTGGGGGFNVVGLSWQAWDGLLGVDFGVW